nr:hypothetical protein [uncultured Mucilaginibacter sp.]
MKAIYLMLALLFVGKCCFSQEPTAQTMADKYFKAYSAETGYRAVTMSDEEIKNASKNMPVGNVMARVFGQIKLYKHVNFTVSAERFAAVAKQLVAAIEKDPAYEQYHSSDNGKSISYLYTLTDRHKIIEFAFVTISKERNYIGVACFAGDDIKIETIKSFWEGK